MIKLCLAMGVGFMVLCNSGTKAKSCIQYDSIKIIIDTMRVKAPAKEPFEFVEQMPRFQCSDNDALLWRYITNRTKYPQNQREAGVTGISYISFIVDRNGKVLDPKIEKALDPDFDNEALNVIRFLPDFCPGMQDGKAVAVKMTIPITFKLH